MNKIGPRGILDNIEKETMLRKLIVKYDENSNRMSKISYKDIFEFVKKEYHLNNIEFYPGYTWWKTKGKYLVDEYNLVKKRTITLSETETLDVFDIIDIIDQNYDDKESLIKYLLPYTEILNRLVKKIENLQSNSQKLKEDLRQKDERISILEQKNAKINALSDSLFYTIIGSEQELIKVMSRGETSSEVINSAITNTFDNPAEYIADFSKRNKIIKEANNEELKNIIEFKHKFNSKDTDDYDY